MYVLDLEGTLQKKLTMPRLNGLGAGPAETAQPTIIADIIFLHDRGKYQTLYFAFYFGSLMVGSPSSFPGKKLSDTCRLDPSFLALWLSNWDGEASGGSTLPYLAL
jgi:hypothetical protein